MNGGIDDCDIAGKQFLELLAWLRDIFLQDAAILQHQFPLFPLWQHPIFCSPDWRSFADRVLVAHSIAEEPMDMRIRKVLPDIEETLRSTRAAVLARVDLHSVNINHTLQEGLARLNDGLNVLRTNMPEQLVTVPQKLISLDAINAYLADHAAATMTTPHACSHSKTAGPTAISTTEGMGIQATMEAASTTSSSSSFPAARTSLIPLTAGGWPVQPYDPNVATVEDAWREWHVGLGAGAAKRDSILALEVKFGTAWRYEQRIRQWHSRRKKVIHMIKQRVEQGHALQNVFMQLNATGKSLDRLRKDVENGIDLFPTS
jgi:hypothetical protein